MATNPKRKASFSGRSRVITQHPHFFTVVLSPFDEGLKIPDSFMRKYGRDLQDVVLLKVPTGVSWEVELAQYGDGRTLLEKGWKEFAEHYSIEKFYFLAFRYLGNSLFNVIIFDPSALEIEYPVETNPDGPRSICCYEEVDEDYEENFSQLLEKDHRKNLAALKGKKPRFTEDMEEDVLVEILEDVQESFSREVTLEDPHPNRNKALKFHPSTTKSKGKKNEDGKSGCSKQKMKKGNSTSVYKTVRNKSIFKSYEKAKAFTSSNPFFISFMQPSFVTKKFYLEIPMEFVSRYLHKKYRRRDSFTLHVSGSRKCWEVTVFFPDNESPKGRIVVGWKEFAQDHGLRVGDVCVFELVPCTKNINVTIYSY